ncbi:hypothetical protein V5H41_28730, partial [Salmonella enterica]
ETAARQLSGRWQKIDEIPFDFERRRMSVVVAEDSSVHQLVCKGSRTKPPRVSSPDAGRKSMRFRLILSVAGCRWWSPK